MKVIDSMWMNSMIGSIGLVVAEDEITGERRAYIGSATGFDEEADARLVIDHGSKVNVQRLKGIIARLEVKEVKP